MLLLGAMVLNSRSTGPRCNNSALSALSPVGSPSDKVPGFHAVAVCCTSHYRCRELSSVMDTGRMPTCGLILRRVSYAPWRSPVVGRLLRNLVKGTAIPANTPPSASRELPARSGLDCGWCRGTRSCSHRTLGLSCEIGPASGLLRRFLVCSAESCFNRVHAEHMTAVGICPSWTADEGVVRLSRPLPAMILPFSATARPRGKWAFQWSSGAFRLAASYQRTRDRYCCRLSGPASMSSN